MQVKASEIKKLLLDIGSDVTNGIIELMGSKKVNEIELGTEILLNDNDGARELIIQVNREKRSVTVGQSYGDHTGTFDPFIKPMAELSNEVLLDILEQIEEDEFEVIEEISED